jgi:tetratricopeptide (TPR) repeat protein
MSARAVCAVLAAALLCGCGGADRARVQDEQLLRSLTAARSAYLQGQPELATGLYREALERARERDDQTAIAEISHDLGAAELQKGDAGAALATAHAALEEMDRRRVHETAPLRLLEAVALSRLGRPAEAAEAARAVASDDRAEPVVRARAVFVEGLVAAQAGDLRTVDQALSQLPVPDPKQPELAADRIELTGWRAFLAGDVGQARRAFLEAADGRRLALDYRGMGRALAAAGDAATRDRDFAAAADLYLRAGRSAMIRKEAAEARLWLGRAEALAARARTPEVLAQSKALIRTIPK